MQSREIVATDEAPRAIGPYSQAVRSGNLVFCSGQLGMDPKSGQLGDDLESQVTRALTNLVAVLEAAGANAAAVVKTTVFLVDMADFAKMNVIYGRFFSDALPARATVAVKELPKGALFEIEAIASIE
jgi:2-iminobutanoate/2-iminopropanoate deaminase